MILLDVDPDWHTQDAVIIYSPDDIQYERFTGTNGDVFVLRSFEGEHAWYHVTAEEWNDLVDDSEYWVGTNLYL